MINITTIRKRMTKGLLLVMLFLAQSVVSSAQAKLYMEDFTLASGEYKQVSLLLDNDQTATQMQVEIALPAGMSYYDGYLTKTDRVKGRGAKVQASTSTGKLVILETGGTIEPGTGEVITFMVRDNGLSVGDHTITLSNIIISDANGDQLNQEETNTVTVKKLGLGDCFFAGPETIDLTVGQEYEVNITLSNEGVFNLSGLQGKLALPAGLEIVPGEDGKFIYSNRTPAPLEFTFKEYDDYISFVLSSSDNTLIKYQSGVIFSFKVKADVSLAENTTILLSDLRVAATSGLSANVPNVEIKVALDMLSVAKFELTAFIDKVKAIETEGKNGADALATAISTAEAALDATTIDEVKAGEEALKQAVSVFNKANLEEGLVEITQSQGKDLDDFTRAELVEGEGYNTYTVNGDLNIAIKMMNLDVKGCDYVVIKFAEPVAAGWHLAFWSNQDLVDVPAGATEFKYVFADDPNCGVSADGVLPQICMMTFFGGFQAPLVAKIEGIYKHVVPVHTWDFTKWSEATIANLKAEAAKGYTEGLWSDAEKADGSASTMEISKDNCFWQVGTSTEGETLTANGEEIAELKGLKFKNNKARSLAIAVNYGDCTSANGAGFGPYHGPAYLWLGSKNVEYFTIPAVKGGTTIKMGVESHKLTDARGVQLFAGETELKDAEGNAVAAPKEYTVQTWAVPAGSACNIVVKNTNGCHIYFIDAEQDEEVLTSISSLKSNIKNDVIYNLNGQKVNKTSKGLYIINGKKVVIK